VLELIFLGLISHMQLFLAVRIIIKMETLDTFSDCHFCYYLVVVVYFGKARQFSIIVIWLAVKIVNLLLIQAVMLMNNLENLSNVIESFLGSDNSPVSLDPIIFFWVEFSLLNSLEILP
jgi:hypothetical protein